MPRQVAVAGVRGKRKKRAEFVSATRIASLHDRFMHLPNTYGTFVGAKVTGGRTGSKLAVVCLVREKTPNENLLAERRIPRTIKWRQGGRNRVVATDVIAVAPSFRHDSGVAGPGDPLSSGPTIGTVGVAIKHPTHGDCITTAGHFIEMAQSPATVQLTLGGDTVLADVRKVQMTPSLDYAVLKPRAGTPCGNLFLDLTRIGPAFDPTFVDIGKPVFVLDRQGANRIPTVCRGVHASINLPEEALSDCILTDLVTQAGQSGTCLIDAQFRVWGLLRGRLGGQFSVFMPVSGLLGAEGARLL